MKRNTLSEFTQWVDKQKKPDWPAMPLTHVTKAITAADIITDKFIRPQRCELSDSLRSYLFYGRPAYRINGENVIKVEAACPCCFVFKGEIINSCCEIYPLDSGAYFRRLYKGYLMDEMKIQNFSLGKNIDRPNRLINTIFRSRINYYLGVIQVAKSIDKITQAWQFYTRSYLNLLASVGRNEPDDRMGSIEIIFDTEIALDKSLMAVVLPHTLWSDNGKKRMRRGSGPYEKRASTC